MSAKPDDLTNKYINNLYDNLSFFDLNMTSVLIFLFITFFVILVTIYCSIMGNSKQIKNNWENEKCKPMVIPFAGFINKPDDVSFIDYTRKNFYDCVGKILKSNLNISMKPYDIDELITSTESSISNVDKSMTDTNENILNVKKTLNDKVDGTNTKMNNMIVPMQQMMYTVKDTFDRTQSILATGLYTSVGNSYILKNMIQESVKFISNIFYLLVIIITMMFAIPSTQGLATVTAGVALPLSLAFITTNESLAKTFHITAGKIPEIPKCFDRKTVLKMNDQTFKTIENVCVGDVLENENVVTAFIKLSSDDIQMYNLNGTIVSGCHNVHHKGEWKQVCVHPDQKIMPKYVEPYIYCLNTTNKTITVNNVNFLDWDELYDDYLEQFMFYCMPYYNVDVNHKSAIHKFLDGGFVENSRVMLKDFTSKQIKEIKIGDELLGGDKVYGLVQIKCDDLVDINKYSLGPHTFKGGPNLNMYDSTDEIVSTLEFSEDSLNTLQSIDKPEKLYHLLTDTKTFFLGGIKFCDYNSLIDRILVDIS
jgi:hypothetical protein